MQRAGIVLVGRVSQSVEKVCISPRATAIFGWATTPRFDQERGIDVGGQLCELIELDRVGLAVAEVVEIM